MKPPGWAVVAVLAAGLAGCGSAPADRPGADEPGVREAVRAWSTAIARQDGPRACALMTASARRQVTDLQGDPDCGSAVRRLSSALGPGGRDQLSRVAVRSVTFPGSGQAVASLGTPDQRLELRRDGGRWIVSDLLTAIRVGGGAYPPAPTSFAPSPPATATP